MLPFWVALFALPNQICAHYFAQKPREQKEDKQAYKHPMEARGSSQLALGTAQAHQLAHFSANWDCALKHK